MDELAHFPDSNHRGLPYSLKQLVAREIEMERMRHESPPTPEVSANAPRGAGKKAANSGSSSRPTSTAEREEVSKKTDRHLQKLEAKKLDVSEVEQSPVDFFGRKIDPEKVRKAAEMEPKNEIVSSDIWFKFKEIYCKANVLTCTHIGHLASFLDCK